MCIRDREFDELARRAPAESSAAIKARVDEARAIQNRRSTSNAHLAQPQLEECCALDDSCQKIMRGDVYNRQPEEYPLPGTVPCCRLIFQKFWVLYQDLF